VAQIGGCDCEREDIGDGAVDSAGIKKLIGAQLAASDGSLDWRPFRTAVRKKGAGIFGLVSRLNMHVLTAAGKND
jgi:hypothetical protein